MPCLRYVCSASSTVDRTWARRSRTDLGLYSANNNHCLYRVCQALSWGGKSQIFLILPGVLLFLLSTMHKRTSSLLLFLIHRPPSLFFSLFLRITIQKAAKHSRVALLLTRANTKITGALCWLGGIKTYCKDHYQMRTSLYNHFE